MDLNQAMTNVNVGRRVSVGGAPWEPVPMPTPPPKVEWNPPAIPEGLDRPRAVVRLARPRPLPDPFKGELAAVRHHLGDDFDLDAVLGAAASAERDRLRGRLANPREHAERAVALENLLAGEDPDDARDAAAVAELLIRHHFAAGGKLDDLLRRAAEQRRQIAGRYGEIRADREGLDLAGFRVPGLVEQVKRGGPGQLEAAMKLAADAAESYELLPILKALQAIPERAREEKSRRCREVIDRFGREAILQGHRESRKVRRLSAPTDHALELLKAQRDEAAREYAAFHDEDLVLSEVGPLEAEAREKLERARLAVEGYIPAAQAAMLAFLDEPVALAIGGHPGELIKAIRAVPRAFPDGLLEALEAIDLEIALAVDPTALAMLIP